MSRRHGTVMTRLTGLFKLIIIIIIIIIIITMIYIAQIPYNDLSFP